MILPRAAGQRTPPVPWPLPIAGNLAAMGMGPGWVFGARLSTFAAGDRPSRGAL
jgi:hypothetical protein